MLFRGEAIAVIVAENLAQAKDAAELVELDVDVLPAVTDARASLEDGAPQLHDIAPNNRALDWELGDPDEAERMIADAHHVTRLKLRNNRVAISPIEPRAAVASTMSRLTVSHCTYRHRACSVSRRNYLSTFSVFREINCVSKQIGWAAPLG